MEELKKNITVAAVFSAEVADTSGEILNIKNADISDLRLGTSPVNVEHINPSDLKESTEKGEDIKGFDAIVGRVITAKKIFSEKDCENQYEEKAWNDLGVPLIFGYVEFFAGPDATPNQNAVASLVRMAQKNQHGHLVGFSVEGQVLKRQNNMLSETRISRLACTAKPANRAATIQGVIQDTSSNSDNAMHKAMKDEGTLYKSINSKQWQVVQDYGLSTALFKLRKALDAGNTAAAPSALSGGAALQGESHLTQLDKLIGKKSIKRHSLKKLLPDATDDQLGKIEKYLRNARLKKYELECEEAFKQLKK